MVNYGKNRINRFVQKYNLVGLIGSVNWDVEVQLYLHHLFQMTNLYWEQ